MNNKKVIYAQSSLWAAYHGLTTAYLVAFALALGASNITIGLLGALPWLASLITQIPGSELVQRLPRKTIIYFFDYLSRAFWIPILAAPFLFENPILFIVLFYLLSKIFETISIPSFRSLIADLVTEKNLGEFVGTRHRLINLFGTITMVLGGLWLKQFPKESPTGFALMFGAGVVFGLIGATIIKRIKEPKYRDHEHHPIKEFFTLNGQIKKYVIFGIAFNFSFMLASPFIAVYMLKNLEMSYQFFGFAIAIPTLTKIYAGKYFGKLTDKYGDKPISLIGHLGTALVPLMFLAVTKANIWLIIPVQIYSGIVWAAADIGHFNLLLGLAEPKKRAMQIAEYTMYASIPMIIAPILGGWITDNLVLILSGIPLIFVMSSVLRAASATLLIRIKEPRAKQEYPLVFVFQQAMHFHPNKGLEYSFHIVKRIAAGLGLK